MEPLKPRPQVLQNALDQLNPLYLAMAADSPYATTTVEKEVHAWLNRFMREAERGSQPLQRPWRSQSGKTLSVKGRALEPDCFNIVETLRGGGSDSHNHRSFLQFAVSYDHLKAVTWAMKSGFNPNRFDRTVTPLGFAAYCGKVDAVKIMWQAGADMLMTLKPGQAIPSMVGSTLLHRVSERAFRHDDEEGLKDVMLFLLSVYPDPQPQDALGQTPLMVTPPGLLRTAMEAWLAQHQSENLKASLKQAPTFSKRTRSRL